MGTTPEPDHLSPDVRKWAERFLALVLASCAAGATYFVIVAVNLLTEDPPSTEVAVYLLVSAALFVGLIVWTLWMWASWYGRRK